MESTSNSGSSSSWHMYSSTFIMEVSAVRCKICTRKKRRSPNFKQCHGRSPNFQRWRASGRSQRPKPWGGVKNEFQDRHLDRGVRLTPLTCRTLPQVRRQERLLLQSQSPKKKKISRPQLSQDFSQWPQKRCKTRQDHPAFLLSQTNGTGQHRRHPRADAPLLPLPSTKKLCTLQP